MKENRLKHIQIVIKKLYFKIKFKTILIYCIDIRILEILFVIEQSKYLIKIKIPLNYGVFPTVSYRQVFFSNPILNTLILIIYKYCLSYRRIIVPDSR